MLTYNSNNNVFLKSVGFKEGREIFIGKIVYGHFGKDTASLFFNIVDLNEQVMCY